MSKLSEKELLEELDKAVGIKTVTYEQIKKMIKKKSVKLYEANINWIEDIIEIVLENAYCDHTTDEDGVGQIFRDINYYLNDEEDVKQRCIEAVPELPIEFELKADKEFIEEKVLALGDISRFHKIEADQARSFILLLVKELVDKIKFTGGQPGRKRSGGCPPDFRPGEED